MVTHKRILVPIDFSEAADAAVGRAEEIAASTRSELVFLHVIDPTPMLLVDGGGFPPADAFADYEAIVEAKLDARVAEARHDRIAARGLIMHGRPEQTIIEAADREQVDMIVLGTHGRRGFRRVMLGSVAERVVRSAKVPVLTVRQPEQDPERKRAQHHSPTV